MFPLPQLLKEYMNRFRLENKAEESYVVRLETIIEDLKSQLEFYKREVELMEEDES